jgi:hypothetical protein
LSDEDDVDAAGVLSVPDFVREDYLAAYDGHCFVESDARKATLGRQARPSRKG